MKNLLCLALLFSLIACGDDSIESCTDLNCAVVGEWDWTHTYGSIGGNTWEPDSVNMSKTLIISDSTIKFLENGTQLNEFSYEVFETDTMFMDTTVWSFIRYDSNIRILEVSDTNLKFQDLCTDCYDDYYVKK